MRCAVGVLVMVGLASIVGSAGAAPVQQAAAMETRVKRVALFKNGVGYFVRTGTLPAAEVVTMGPFAAATHGTFWFSYPKEVAVAGLVARETSTSDAGPVQDFGEFLAANVGKTVSVTPNAQNAVPVRGMLLSVTTDREPVRPDPYGWGRGGEAPGRGYYPTPMMRLAMIQTDDGVVVVNCQSLVQAAVIGEKPVTTYARKGKGWQLEARLGKTAAGTPVSASYLAKGITWVPSYVVDISDPKLARISAKAEIINEAEALAGTHIDLVTGFPNLQFSDVVSPLAGKETLASFLSSLGRGASPLGTRSEERSRVMTQSVMANYADFQEGFAMPEYGAAAAGASVEDLFFYPVENVTLAKGEVGYYPLFTESVPYTQVYTWEIPDYVNEQDRYGDPRRQRPTTQEEVWHSIKLTNAAKIPWTTAPAQTVKTGQLLGQDTLNFVSPGAKATLKITRAVSVKAEQNEYETKRERGAVNLYGDTFDRITLQGTLRVTNYKADAVTVEVKKTLSGEVKTTTPAAKVERLARGLSRMNPLNVVTWSVDVKPGEAKEITYTYEALIRR